MQYAAPIGAFVYGLLNDPPSRTSSVDAMDAMRQYVWSERTPSPSPDRQAGQAQSAQPQVQPSPERNGLQPPRARRITRRASWDLPLGEYIDRCCREIIGTDGSPGIGNHQAQEQVYFLQQLAIRRLEHPDDDNFVDDREVRREAARIRDAYRHAVEAQQEKERQRR